MGKGQCAEAAPALVELRPPFAQLKHQVRSLTANPATQLLGAHDSILLSVLVEGLTDLTMSVDEGRQTQCKTLKF
jgi:hypothetical protein